jgi:sporulation protein YlmC with PRC-barrel domain
MYHNLKKLHGYKIATSDGHIGHVKDFYFNDYTWAIRYLVVDTGSWLSGRLVLISPHSFGYIDEDKKTLTVNLSKKQIEHSPSIDTHKPVSRQYETEYYSYYGYPTYWSGGGLWGMGGYPMLLPATEVFDGRMDFVHRDDPNLRSAAAVTGYKIEAVDGTLGHITDFKVDDRSWAIPELVVEAGHWYSGKEVLISPWKVERISYAESKVFVSLTKEDIRKTSEHAVVQAGA